MPKADFILLHPPSVYDFRTMPILYGPISDLIPSTQIFEMYPIGFLSIAEYLERNGFSVRIVNLAMKMLSNPKLNVEEFIRRLSSLEPIAIGIDLHWLPHIQGSLEIAKLIKKYDIPTIFGGLAATYFHKELINYPQVDFIVRGDSTEEPILQLVTAISKRKVFEEVPNLTYKSNGKVYVNLLTYIPNSIDYIFVDYSRIIKSVTKYRDLIGHLPFENWLSNPLTAVLTCRGCRFNCIVCGGSCYTYRTHFSRNRIAFRSPKKLAEDVTSIGQYLRGPIFIIGDIRQGGMNYSEEFLNELKNLNIENQLVLEFFYPAPRNFLEKIANTIPNFNFQISPETHDENLRRIAGRPYSNRALEKTIELSLELDCGRIDVFFMIGLPSQSYDSVLATSKYIAYLLKTYGSSKRLHLFISPLAPFLDPGSIAFDHPEKYGFRILCKSLDDYRTKLTSPTWEYSLGYETNFMTREQIVECTYQTALALTKLKTENRLIDKRNADKLEKRITRAITLNQTIKRIIKTSRRGETEEQLVELKSTFENLNQPILCNKEELQWSSHQLKFKLGKILKMLLIEK